jgi:glyoxylase-like metal-dependent hydrolase (beta-lactamase superfamily II)
VDAPQDLGPIEEAVRRAGLRIAAVAETHTHADHVSGARPLAAAHGVPIHMPELSAARFPHLALKDGGEVRVGDLRLRSIHTPGHTPDAMTLLAGERALVGDTLLVGTAGRADFYARGPEELYHSLFDRLLRFGDELAIYPAHYGKHHGLPDALMTTLGHERKVNEALTQKTKEDFVKYMTEGWPPKPHGWERIVEVNNSG